MRRIRLLFAALALLIGVPLGLLLAQAFESADLAREAQHRVVAERVFDEMERQLSELLAGEEARPFSEYRFYASDAPPVRSPLSYPPSRTAADYFQLDPDSSFHSPLLPRDRVAAEARGDWRPSPALERRVARLETLVRRGFAESPGRRKEAAAGLAQAPGTTRSPALERDSDAVQLAADAGEAEVADERLDAYGALQRLNVGVKERRAKRGRAARAQDVEALERPAEAPALALAERVEFSAKSLAAPAPAPPRSAILQPMLGNAAGSEHLLLYRTVLLEGRGYRQGLVLEVAPLAQQLQGAVLGPELARQAELRFRVGPGADRGGEATKGRFVYLHRFAEPFDDLAVEMSLLPLVDAGGRGYLTAIAALVLLAAAGGLLALYRSVAVTVRFAERRSNFVAAVTHELRTPLTTIRMYGEMLRDGMVDEDKRAEYYSTITAESDRLSRLINNVLEFSRLEQGTREMSLVVGSIGPVVAEALRLLEPHARDAGFALALSVEDDLPAVRFERDAMLQVVFNLVDNALKYARGAEGREVRLECAAGEDGVELRVRDRGPGVEPRHLSKIFEPFYRGQDELTRTTQGTGIGLALVRGLAEHMGAALSGRNCGDGGFEVTLRFPAAAKA